MGRYGLQPLPPRGGRAGAGAVDPHPARHRRRRDGRVPSVPRLRAARPQGGFRGAALPGLVVRP
eukprot:3378391-Lingulodinium_polyedra.AAC.1